MDKWELLHIHGGLIDIFTPNEWNTIGVRDYLKSKGKDKVRYEEEEYMAISCILAGGWEPYGYATFYRRKINE